MAATLYGTIVNVIGDYLGPAASRFVDRLAEFHLNKSPQAIDEDDLDHLIQWTRVSLALLTNDQSLIDECLKRLSDLHESQNQRSHH